MLQNSFYAISGTFHTLLNNTNLYLSYFILSYVFLGHNDSVEWGLTVSKNIHCTNTRTIKLHLKIQVDRRAICISIHTYYVYLPIAFFWGVDCLLSLVEKLVDCKLQGVNSRFWVWISFASHCHLFISPWKIWY